MPQMPFVRLAALLLAACIALAPPGALRHATAATSGGMLAPVYPDAVLAQITGEGPLPRTEVTARVWNYIHRHGLIDRTNRRMINCDDTLRVVAYGKDQLSMFELTAVVNRRLRTSPS